MDLVFVDDSKQIHPTRPGMGPLVASGGVVVHGPAVGRLETRINEICQAYGFPDGEEFKWSPGSNLWMRRQLVAERRTAFFGDVLDAAAESSVIAVVAIVDTNYRPVTGADSHELDTVALFLERVENFLRSAQSEAIVIADRPGGGQRQEEEWLTSCLQTLLTGTEFVELNRIPINVVTTTSDNVRLLQLADLVTSCTTQYFAGEPNHAPLTFPKILPLLREDFGVVGGRGVKLHPDYRYANLYHWLLGDAEFVRFQGGIPMPLQSRAYALGPDAP